MGAPVLSLGLGIDFGALDRQLGQVADRIEKLGKGHSLKLGATVKDVASGQFDPEKLGAAVAEVGTRLSEGVASGVRASSGLMLGLAAHVNTVLDRLAGASITLFRRIDSSMKFPLFDTAMKSAQLKLTNFTRVIGRKPLSSLDLALQGGMGPLVGNIAKVAKVLFDSLGESLRAALAGVAAGITGELKLVTAELGKVVAKLGEAKSQAAGAVPIFGEMARAAAQAGAPPPSLAGPIPPRSQVPGHGRRIGFGADFSGPAPAPDAALPKADRFAEFRNAGVRAAAAIKTAAGDAGAAFQVLGAAVTVTGRTFAQVGAAFVSVPLRGVIAVRRLTNFVSSLGDVGKKSFHDLYESHGLFLGSILHITRPIRALTSSLLHLGTLNIFKKHESGARGAAVAIGGLAEKARGLGSALLLTVAAGAGVYSTFEFFKHGVAAASALNETVSRTRVVFGNAFAPVEAQAAGMERAFGLSRNAQLDIASGFGAMAQGAGMTEAASAGLADQMTRMAADLSSSVNIPFQEAGEKLRSALAGQSEPLRQFGVMISEDAVKAYALAHGLARSKDAISEQAKVMSRAALIVQGLGYAQGDLERTAESPANLFRKIGGQVEALSVKVGQALLPAVTIAAKALTGLADWVSGVFERNKAVVDRFTGFFAGVVATFREGALRVYDAFGGITGAVDSAFGAGASETVARFAGVVQEKVAAAVTFAGSVIRNIPEYFALAGLKIQLEVLKAQDTFNSFSDRVVALGSYAADQLARAFDVAFDKILAMAGTLEDRLAKLFRGKLGLAEVGAFKAPALDKILGPGGLGAPGDDPAKALEKALKKQDIEDRMKALWETIGKNDKAFGANLEAELAKLRDAGAAAGPKKPGPAAEPAEAVKPHEIKLASAVEIGSKEAYSAIAKSQAGGKTTTGAVQDLNATAKQQLQVNREQLAVAKAAQGKAAPGFQVK